MADPRLWLSALRRRGRRVWKLSTAGAACRVLSWLLTPLTRLDRRPSILPPLCAGLNLRAVFRAVQQYGACEERLFPYEERTLKYSPNKGEAGWCLGGEQHCAVICCQPVQPTLDYCRQTPGLLPPSSKP